MNLYKEEMQVMADLKVELENKKKELDTLVEKKQDLLDPEVYIKSCELDKLVVKVMRGWKRDFCGS